MMTVREPARDVPLLAEVDVVVAGGGAAGMGAAVAAARNGARTLLLERYAFLGGNATAGYVLKYHGFKRAGERVVRGIPWEFAGRMKDLGGAWDLSPDYDGILFDPEVWKLAANRMLLESGARLLLHTLAVGVLREGDRITHVLVENKSGRQAVAARVFIDATGTGDIAVRAGVPHEKGRPGDGGMQPMCLCFRLGGVRPFETDAVRQAMEEGVAAGAIGPFGGPWIDFINRSPGRETEVLVNTIRAWGDSTSGEEMSREEVAAREKVWRLVGFLRERVAAFRDAYLLDTAAQLGIREAIHCRGRYRLTLEDVLAGRKFPDGIAAGAWSVDIHAPDTGSTGWHSGRLSGGHYLIPYRCLLPEGVRNLLLAGACISATHEAWASARVMATCMAMGQAAGTAAALAVRHGISPARVNPDELRSILAAQGACVG